MVECGEAVFDRLEGADDGAAVICVGGVELGARLGDLSRAGPPLNTLRMAVGPTAQEDDSNPSLNGAEGKEAPTSAAGRRASIALELPDFGRSAAVFTFRSLRSLCYSAIIRE
jgi:hypothetical protein